MLAVYSNRLGCAGSILLSVLGSLILHLHPVKVRRSGVRMSYTWCMGGTSFFLFLVEMR